MFNVSILSITAMRKVKLGITLLKALATVGEVYAKPA